MSTRAPLYSSQARRPGIQAPQQFSNNLALYTTSASALILGTALMAQPVQSAKVQPPQPFQNTLRFYTPIPFGAQVLAAPGRNWSQPPQVFPSTFGLYQPTAPIRVTTIVDVQQPAPQRQQPQPFGNLLSLFSSAAVLPPMGAQIFDVRIRPPQVQAPQPFPNTLGLYTTLAYIPASAQLAAQVVFAPRWAQTTPQPAFVSYSATYSWPATVVGAQINRVSMQPATVAAAPLTLYSSTYTPPSTRIDVQPFRSVQPQGFAQSAQIGLYQPQVYRPPQSPRFESPRLLPYSFAYQGFAQVAQLPLYSTSLIPISDQTETLSGPRYEVVWGPVDETVSGPVTDTVNGPSSDTFNGPNDDKVSG